MHDTTASRYKFRAWDDGKKEWLLGYELPSLGGFSLFGEAVMFGEWGAIVDQFIFERNGHKQDDLKVMQFTGIHDRNGKEIYESDVIKAKHDDGHYDIGEVVYGRKGAFCISLPDVGTGIKIPLLNYIHGIMFDESDIEVIGNVFENPDLLTASRGDREV